MHRSRWICGLSGADGQLCCTKRGQSQMHQCWAPLSVVPFTGKGKLILFLWVGTISIASGPFVNDPRYHIAVTESKDSIQESTQKPSIHNQKENDDNSFFSPLHCFILKNFKLTGWSQENYNEYLFTIHLDWSVINILPHLCLLFVCVCDTYTYTYIYSFLIKPLNS